MEITSLIASIVSVAIGILAIWLSIVFYKMSSQLSESTKEAAKGIGASVDRLEKLFDTLYSDTFSMMKDTVSDMRKHMWPDEAKTEPALSEKTEKKADEKADLLKEKVDKELGRLLERQKVTDSKLNSLSTELRELVNQAINESRKVEGEAREETLREIMINEIRLLTENDGMLEADTLVRKMLKRGFSSREVFAELHKMRDDATIADFGPKLYPDTTIGLAKIA